MKRVVASGMLVLVLLASCDSYTALFLRDGPWDIHNEELLKGNVIVSNPDDMGFTFPVQIHKPRFGGSSKTGMVGWDFDDEARIYWTAVTGADQYQILATNVTILELIDDDWLHYPEAEFDVSGNMFGPLTMEENYVDTSELNTLIFGSSGNTARNRLQNTFSPDRSAGSEGLFLYIRARVNGIWSDWTDGSEPFIEVFYQEAAPWV
jgi:hypothetical protein